jgi:hypothetical protein
VTNKNGSRCGNRVSERSGSAVLGGASGMFAALIRRFRKVVKQ